MHTDGALWAIINIRTYGAFFARNFVLGQWYYPGHVTYTGIVSYSIYSIKWFRVAYLTKYIQLMNLLCNNMYKTKLKVVL